MDQIEFEVIQENTRLLAFSRIQAETEKLNRYPYRVVTEDPDRIGLCHIFEGGLFVRGFEQAPPAAREMMKRILLEQFDAEAWKYEEQISSLVSQLRVAFVGIGKKAEEHHTCHESLRLCESNVLRSAPDNALVISTLHNPWQVGLLIGTGLSLVKSQERRPSEEPPAAK
jgi:hypothetical protein